MEICREEEMAMNCLKSLRSVVIIKESTRLGGCRTFAVGKAKGSKGGDDKKGSKGDVDGDASKASTLDINVKSTTVVGANILKVGEDPKILADSEYPDWLFHLLDKRPMLSELKRKNVESLPYEDLKRFAKLDNRARIKENNAAKAKK